MQTRLQKYNEHNLNRSNLYTYSKVSNTSANNKTSLFTYSMICQEFYIELFTNRFEKIEVFNCYIITSYIISEISYKALKHVYQTFSNHSYNCMDKTFSRH